MILGNVAILAPLRRVKRLHTRGKGSAAPLCTYHSLRHCLIVRTFTAHKHDANYTNIPIVSSSSRARVHNSFGHIVHEPSMKSSSRILFISIYPHQVT